MGARLLQKKGRLFSIPTGGGFCPGSASFVWSWILTLRKKGKKGGLVQDAEQWTERKTEKMKMCPPILSNPKRWPHLSCPVLPFHMACGRGALMQLCPGPFFQPADRPVDAVNQAKTSWWRNGDRASKKWWSIGLSSSGCGTSKTGHSGPPGEFSSSAKGKPEMDKSKKHFFFRYHQYE